MGDRPESDSGSGPAGRGDPDSPSDETIRLERPTGRDSHSVGDTAPGSPAGQPSVQRDANIPGVSASDPQGPHPSTQAAASRSLTIAAKRPEQADERVTARAVALEHSGSELAPHAAASRLHVSICASLEDLVSVSSSYYTK